MKPPRLLRLVLLSLVFAASGTAARAQLYVARASDGSISEYDTSTGALIKDSMITGLGHTCGLAYDGGALFVINQTRRMVAKYDAQTGIDINRELVTGLEMPSAIAVSGRDLYVATFDGGSAMVVGKYDAVSGAVVFYKLISEPDFISALAVRGRHLFVAHGSGMQVVDEYDAVSGQKLREKFIDEAGDPPGLVQSGGYLWINHDVGAVTRHDGDTGRNTMGVMSPLVSGLSATCALAVSGDDLFIASRTTGSIGKYNATTGAVINASFITGQGSLVALATVPSATTGSVSDDWAMLFDQRSFIVLLTTTPPWVVDGIGLCVLALVVGLIVNLLMRGGSRNRSLRDEVFPNGVKNVNILSFSGAPAAGCLIVADGVQAQLAGLQVGDIIVALDGIQVENEEQHLFVDATGTDSRMTWIVWRGHRYQEISAWVPERKLDAHLQTYPAPATPANP
jgi:hypothetical protein